MRKSILLFVAVLGGLGNAHGASPFADKPVTSYCGAPNLTWGMAPLNDFGSRTVAFDASGVRAVRQVPAPGAHPRIYFTPDDLPEVRRRLKETRCGQEAWKNLLCWTEMMKGAYDDSADYAKPDVWKGGFGGLHGRVPLFRLGVPREKGFAYNKHPQAAAAYRGLVDGSGTSFPDYYWNVFSLEAFRCLISTDEPAAKDLAAATITALKIEQSRRDAKRSAKDAAPPAQPAGAFQLAFIYDYLYGWLTPAQRAAIHDELAACTWNHDNYGTFNEATASRSNWATFSYWLLETLAIEGEPGFNDLKVRGIYRGCRNLFTYGWFQSGATFEGEAKNQLGMDCIIPLAMREKEYGLQNLCAHPYLRAYATNFLPKSVIPTLDGFIKYDLLGGAHGRPMAPDCIGLKFMFPDDKIIDWVYRSAVGENYENVPDRCDGYRNDLLFFLAYASDFDPANNDPAKLNVAATFFCGERALLMTRSGWDKNALMLNMHTREANGGHPFADRNSIQLAGAGRVWSAPPYSSFKTPENSVVCIDEKSQSLQVPGRMVDFVDRPMATFAVGDAKYCWDWNWRTIGKSGGGNYTIEDAKAGRLEVPPGWQAEIHTVNDFSYLKLPFAYLNAPLTEQPHWCALAGSLSPVVRQPFYPVQRAFRTAGLVRGKHPYALVVDDIQKDEVRHHYNWILTLEKDITIAKIERNGPQMDVILKGDASPAMLLVRFLSGQAIADPKIDDLPNQSEPKKYQPIHRLVVASDSVAPEFKVLLYPYPAGDALPKTRWNADGSSVRIDFADQSDELIFAPSKSGKTNVAIKRDGATLVDVAREIEPLRDALIEAEVARVEQIRKQLAGFDPESISGRVMMPPLADLERVAGKTGRAVKFVGAKDGCALPVNLKTLGANGFSVLFWCLGERDGSFISCNGNRGFALGIEHGSQLRTDALGQHRWKGNTPLNFDQWHQLAVTSDGQTLTVYVDGRVLKSEAIQKPIDLSPTTTLGANFAGLLDDLRVYNRALTAAEIEKLFQYQMYGAKK